MPDVSESASHDGLVLTDLVRSALTRVIDPEIRKPITELDMVAGASVDDAG
ncbi:MAG: hypothetical protein QOD05_1174, partial [Microbacteriaceae bacterium]|nr:hypothetical protein [Microbacteriaceae bacterium]